MRFCEKLKQLRQIAGYGFNEFWKEAKISNVYLSGLENGTKPPPPPDRQVAFVEILNKSKKLTKRDITEFFDLAAEERNELPADIVLEFNHARILKELRKVLKEKENV